MHVYYYTSWPKGRGPRLRRTLPVRAPQSRSMSRMGRAPVRLRFLDVTLEQLVQHRTSALFGPHDLVVPFVDARRFLFEDLPRVLQIDPGARMRGLFASEHGAACRIDGEPRLAARAGHFENAPLFG